MIKADYYDKINNVDYYFHEVEDHFENELNECYDMVEVCGREWPAGTLYRRADPIGFTESVHNYINGQLVSGDWVEL